ncbi:hypothetical protein GDO78_002145, partial [Eleutherodactylus coqui]
ALIAGLVIYSFIIGVNFNDWWKGRSVIPVDHIVTSLGISRICAQCAKIMYLLMKRFFLSRQNFDVNFITSIVYFFFTYVNFWLTSLLSIVFCLKISNFHTRLFLYLRGMIVRRTVYFIVASVVFSAFSCLMSLTLPSGLYRDGLYNTIMPNLSVHCTTINYVYTFTVGAIIPLLLYCISSGLLFSSLYHHTTKMTSNLSINLETYYSLMRFVFVTFIYNTLYFIGHFVCVFYYYFYCMSIGWIHIALDILPLLHSSYLIYRTPKLRSQMFKGLQYLSDFVSQRKDMETRENM